jgi:hypothetical protein
MSIGSYSLASLGWGLWSFRDCPDAYAELMHVRLRGSTSIAVLANPSLPGGDLTLLWFQEIREAKSDLRAKGVTVD